MRRHAAVARAHRDAHAILCGLRSEMDAQRERLAERLYPGLLARATQTREALGAAAPLDGGGEPIAVVFGRPRAVTAKWLEATLPGADGLGSHHWRRYIMSRPDLYAYATAALRRKDAVDHLFLAARTVTHSTLSLSEAAGVVVDMMLLDPRPGWGFPRQAANDWATVGIGLVDTWEYRSRVWGGDGVGDPVALAEHVDTIRDSCGRWQIDQAERDLADRRARLNGPMVIKAAS